MSNKQANAAFVAKMAERRAQYAPEVKRLYSEGFGHKAIAKLMGIAPRLARTILIEIGVYQPGKLQQGEKHKAATVHGRQAGAAKNRRLGLIRRTLSANKKSIQTTLSKWKKHVRSIQRKALTEKQKKAYSVKQQQRYMERYRTEPAFRMKAILRKAILRYMKGTYKTASTQELLGCTWEEYRAHIERQFVKGMTWDNHGNGHGKWHVDHIIPCSSFDLLNPTEQKRCFHYTNLRPLWAIANIKKRAKLPKQHQWLLV